MKKLDQFNITRLIAALSVVFYHTGQNIFPFTIFPFDPLFISGASAVSYFFLLSGFVIALAYCHPGERFNFKRYWLARFSRIYPLYLFAFFLTCLHFMDATVRASMSEYLSALLLLQAWVPDYVLTFNFPAWAMSMEVFFYLVFPLLAIWMARTKLSVRIWIWMSLGFWAVNQVVLFWLARMLPNTLVVYNLLSYFPLSHLSIFVMGVVAGMWYVRFGQQNQSDQMTTRWLFLFALVLISVMVIGKGSVGVPITKNILAPFALVILLALSMETTILARLLTRPWMLRLAEASYGVFVLHMPIRWIFSDLMQLIGIKISPSIDYLIYIMLLIFLSLLLHDWIERPARNWLQINAPRIWLIVGDLVLLICALFLSYFARVGLEISGYSDSINFSLRIGIPIYLFLLISFRAYRPIPVGGLIWWLKRSLLPVALIGTVILTGLLMIALKEAWIGAYPRSMPLVYMFVLSSFLFMIRYLLQRWKPEMIGYFET